MGDFNFNPVSNLMLKFLNFLITPSHPIFRPKLVKILGSFLDHVYHRGSLKHNICLHESFFSDHSIILASFGHNLIRLSGDLNNFESKMFVEVDENKIQFMGERSYQDISDNEQNKITFKK